MACRTKTAIQPDAGALAGVGVWSSVVVVAVTLLCRRLAGGFDAPVAPWPAVVVGTIGTGLAFLARLGLRSVLPTGRAPAVEVVFGAALLGPPFVAALPLVPDGSVLAVCYLLGLLVLAVAALVAADPRLWPGVVSGSEEPRAGEAVTEGGAAEELPDRHDEAGLEADSLDADPNVRQWTRRSATGKGQELLEGHVRVEFGAGEKTVLVHVPFWPAFGATPEVECEPLDDVDVDVKVGEVRTWGARLEVNRDGACEDAFSALVGIAVSGPVAAGRVGPSDLPERVRAGRRPDGPG